MWGTGLGCQLSQHWGRGGPGAHALVHHSNDLCNVECTRGGLDTQYRTVRTATTEFSGVWCGGVSQYSSRVAAIEALPSLVVLLIDWLIN